MADRKAVIKNADMSEDMQQDAVDCASQALEKYNIEKDIAAYIKKEFDKKYNPTWHCIVGRNFGSYTLCRWRAQVASYMIVEFVKLKDVAKLLGRIPKPKPRQAPVQQQCVCFGIAGADIEILKDIKRKLDQNSEDLATIKLRKAGPSGDHATYSVFYKELVESGVNEIQAIVVPTRDIVAAAGSFNQTVESMLVAAMTPLLQGVLSGGMPNMILSNTEEVKWIKAGGDATNDQKCDLVLLLDGLQVPHDPTGSIDLKTYRGEVGAAFNYKFGTPLYQLRAFISGIIEYKVKGLNKSAKGELASYLKHLSPGDDPNTYVGLLCDRSSYVTASCTRGVISDFVSGEWSDPGSAEHLRQRFSRKNKWLELLLGLCEKLNVRLCPEADRSAFLGRGGYGVVFRVMDNNNQIFALKAVLYGQNATASSLIKVLLPAEYQKLRNLDGACVVSVVEGGPTVVLDITGEEMGAGYLMKDIGQQIAVADCFDGHSFSALGLEVFKALQNLHAGGYCHGDARIANIVRIGKSVKWIDMMMAVEDTIAAKRNDDIKTLLKSVLPPNTELMQFDLIMSAYSQDCSEVNMGLVCAAVIAIV